MGSSRIHICSKHRRPRRHSSCALVCCSLVAGVTLLSGCFPGGPPRTPRPRLPEATLRDTPAILRGTVGAETLLRGEEFLLVSGYGLVVGLNGTGSADIPPSVRAILEREMTRRGVGREGRGLEAVSPSQLLSDLNTAVVLAQAAIPPGAPVGTTHDVLVTALPGTATTSLEGGRLWTADMRAGLLRPGAPDTRVIAQARGDIFINPFADPAQDGTDDINRRIGRVLSGAVVTEARQLTLVLDSPSHARARLIVSAINTQFPQAPGDREPTARGVNEELIEITPPQQYRDNLEDFVQLLLAARIQRSFPEEWAHRYATALKEQPEYASELSWRLQSIGKTAIPMMRNLYDSPDILPRLAALRAGAALGDALTTAELMSLAQNGAAAIRVAAIELLGDAGSDPQINLTLRELADDDAIEVRIAAYEALVARADPLLDRRVFFDKFVFDSLPSTKPLIYVTQQDDPRIAVFGDAHINRPTLVFGWSDRLILSADSDQDPLRVYYLDHVSGESTQATVSPDLVEFIEFLAHKQTPESPAPGLNLTYSQVVGALHEIWKNDGMNAQFVAEQDKLAAELLRSITDQAIEERPEFSDDGADEQSSDSDRPTDETQVEEGDPEGQSTDSEPEKPKSYVVPVPRLSKPK